MNLPSFALSSFDRKRDPVERFRVGKDQGMTVLVTAPRDPRLGDYLRLTDVALRRVKEPAEGLFIAEGEKVIRRALAAGYPLRSLLLEEKWLEGLADVVAAAGVPVYVVARDVLDAATGYAVHRGALAAMSRTELPAPADLVEGASRLAVLEDVNDHTNVGAIFRAAAGLGVDGVLLSPRCADPLYRRAVKVSMGAVFALPYARLDSWRSGLDLLRDAGFTTVALTPGDGSLTLAELADQQRPRLALLLGAEGTGLRPATIADADVSVRIPMARGVDSLNVAAAAAVAFYATAPENQSRR
jgi:tRNA G18 (ribose-2'-O)-methylase SpoU